MNKIGILGGTFNPIHNAHIKLAKKAIKDFGLSCVVFIPTGTPPHKSTNDLASRNDRLNMVRLAIKGEKKLKVSKIEINKKGYSYAVDTFGKLKKRFGSKSKLFYIMGLDSINTILSWKRPIELFKLCQFIVATRPGSKIKTFKRIMKFPPISINRNKIFLTELKVNLSSSEIRRALLKGKMPKNVMPENVEKYIAKNELYR